jgi:acetyl/propionyl-CoA carboxylase alpha subunit
MSTQFTRVAIVNRGEPPMRFMRAVRDFNRERGTQIRSLIFHTNPDRHARFVREGGRGIRRVDSETSLAAAYESARQDARRIFGQSAVYLEKWRAGARHVEVQILADHYGVSLFACSQAVLIHGSKHALAG